MTDFDDIPVGGKSNKNQFEEFEKNVEMEIDEKSKPLEERVKSKNFSTRKEAFEEIFNQIKSVQDKNNEIFLKNLDYYTLMLNDAHFLAQEVGLNVIEYVFTNYEKSNEFSSQIIKIIIEKCYSSTKTNIKEKAQIVICLGAEISLDLKGICEVIKSCLEKKNPKVQGSALQVLSFIISNFGSFKVDYRPLLTLVEKITESTSPSLRNDALEVYKELYRWVRDSIKPNLSKLKEAYQKDLEKSFDEISKNQPKIPQPKKYLKNDKPKINSGVGEADLQNKIEMMKMQEENYNLAEAIEVFSQFTDDWCSEILKKEKKWVEKKEMLELFIKKCSVFKIKNSSHSHITTAFVRLFKDSNINVVNYTILAINTISVGLRKEFTEAKEFFPLLLEKLKDKNKKLVADTFTCLENLLQYSLSFEETLEHFSFGLSNDKATIQSKEKICNLIEKTILKTYITQLRKMSKNIGDLLYKVTDDASSEVRDSSLHCLGVLKFRIGDVALSKILIEISEIKKKKIEEASNENIVVDPIYNKEENKKNVNQPVKMEIDSFHSRNASKNVQMKIDPPLSTRDVNMSFNSNNNEEMGTNPNQINPSKPQAIKQPNLTNKPKSVAQKTKPSNNQPNNKQTQQTGMEVDEEDSNNISNEEIEEIIKLKLGPGFIENMNNSKWDVRRDAFIELNKWILTNVDEARANIDIILRYQKLKLKDYKENNFNILKEALTVIDSLLSSCDNFSKKHAVPIIKKTHEKIGDNKVKDKFISVLFKMMDYLSPKYILNLLLKQMNTSKPINVLKESSAFIEKTIEEYGLNLLPVKEVVEFGKILASHANPQLRTSATNLFCLIYKYMGPTIKKFMNDIKEATLKIIETEFEKIQVVTGPSNRRELKGEALNEANQINEQGNNLDSLFPRVDISKKLTPKILKDLNEGNWQIKKENLETIEKIMSVDGNSRILPSGLNELVNTIKNKLSESNKNLVRILLQFLTKFFEALGTHSNSFLKILIKPIIVLLGDKNNILREDVIKCLEKLGEMIGFEKIFSFFPPYLLMDNFEMRNDILKFILKFKTGLSKSDCKEFMASIVICLQDRSLLIKGLTEDLIKEITKYVHPSQFTNHLRDLKPAIQADIKKIIEKCSSDTMIIDVKKPVENTTNNAQDFKCPNNIKQPNKNNTNKEIIKDKKQIGKKESSGSNEKGSKGKNVNVNFKGNQQMPNIKVVNPSIINSIPEIVQLQQLGSDKMDIVNTSVINLHNIKHKQKEKRLEGEKHFQLLEFYNDLYINNLNELLSNFLHPKYTELAKIKDLNKNNTFVISLQNSMRNETLGFIEILDVIIKWLFIKTVENNNSFFWDNILLEFLMKMIQFLMEIEYNFHDIESKLIFNMIGSKLFSSNPNVKNNTKSIFTILIKLSNFEVFFEFLSDRLSKIPDKTHQTELIEFFKLSVKNYKFNVFPDLTKKILTLFTVITDEKQKLLICDIIGDLLKQNENVGSVIKDAPIQLFNYLKSNINSDEMKNISKNEPKPVVMMIDDNYNKSTNTINEVYNIPKPINIQSVPKQFIQNEYKSTLSKSPLVIKPNNPNINTHLETPISIKPQFTQEHIDNIVTNLIKMIFSERNLIFVDLLNIVKNKFDEYSGLLEKNINKIFMCLINYLSIIFDNLNTEQYFESLKYLLPILLCLAQQKELAEKLELNNLHFIYEKILNLMLYKDLEKVRESERLGKIVLKSLNELLFNLMENCKSSDSYIILIKIIQSNRNTNEKVCDLSIKCILKLNKVLPQIIDEVEISKVFSAIYHFLSNFRDESLTIEECVKSKCDDMCLRIMKSIVNEIFKIKKDKIWVDGYNQCDEKLKENNSKKQDIRNWIVRFMRTVNGQSLPPISTLTSRNEIDEEMNSLISKVKTDKESKNIQVELLSLIRKRKLDLEVVKSKFNEEEFKNLQNLWKNMLENEESILKNSVKNDNSTNIISNNLETNKPAFLQSNSTTNLQMIANVKNLTDDPGSRLNHYRNILYNLNREKSVNKDGVTKNMSQGSDQSTNNNPDNQNENKTINLMEKFQKLKEISKKENLNDLSEKKITNPPAKSNNEEYINKLNEWKQRLDQFNNMKK